MTSPQTGIFALGTGSHAYLELDLQANVQQQLALAENVEKAQVIEPAAAVKTTARSGRNGALIGALLGLLLGCAAALLADPFLARRARTA